MYKSILLTIAVLPLFALAQINNDPALRVAKEELKSLRYAYAIPFLKKHIAKYPQDTASLTSLGYCYKMINKYDSAILYYEKANNLKEIKDNSLAELYANEGDYSQAVKLYSQLLQSSNLSADSTRMYTSREKGYKEVNLYSLDSLDYVLRYMKINSSANEYNAVIYDNGIVFESNRARKIKGKNEFGWDGAAYSKLYYLSDTTNMVTDSFPMIQWEEKHTRKAMTDYSAYSINDNNNLRPKFSYLSVNSKYMESPLFSDQLDQSVNYGALTMIPNGKVIYITRSQKNQRGINQLEIWRGQKDITGRWTVEKLPFNKSGYSYFHPAVTPDDSRLYFSSDQPGGYGGTDIYYVDKQEDGHWGNPVNAGKIINTAGNELFPTYYDGILYFSSNGHDGLGGIDIFKFEGKDTASGNVVNLGYPVNSNKDDFGYSRKGNKGYFSSNRYGSDDVFEYEYNRVMVTLKGKVKVNGANPKQRVYVKVYSNDNGVKGQLLDSTIADGNGDYSVKVRPNHKYLIEMNTNDGGKLSDSGDAINYVAKNTGKGIEYEKYLQELNLQITGINNQTMASAESTKPKEAKLSDNKKLDASLNIKANDKNTEIEQVVESFIVYYDYDKSDIKEAYKKTLDSVIDYLSAHKDLKAVIGSFTDCAGSSEYNDKLSGRRSSAVIKYLSSNGVRRDRIVDGHYGKEYLVEACIESNYHSDEQWRNRRTEIFISKVKNKSVLDLRNEIK